MPGRPWQVRQTTLEVDLGLLKQNYHTLLRRAEGADLLVLLKSDAYGHSHKEIAAALDSLPAEAKLHGFGVANVEEGIELRREGVKRPVYVLSGIQNYDEELHRCLDVCSLTPVISSLRVLRELSKYLRESSSTRQIHLKFNTGMNRLGIDPTEIEEAIRLLKATPGILVQGLLSHLCCAEKPNHKITKNQAKKFREIVKQFRDAGFSPLYTHLENSAGLANHVYPEGNISRVGLNIYGVGDKKLQAISRWTAQIYQVRDVNKGESIGYGPNFTAKKKMKMAVLGVGYGDGYRRLFSNQAEVLVQGKRCKVIGSVSMDLTAIDVSKIKNIQPGQRAVLMGKDGKDEITAEELALHAKTIPWEVLTGISPRVPRIFSNEL